MCLLRLSFYTDPSEESVESFFVLSFLFGFHMTVEIVTRICVRVFEWMVALIFFFWQFYNSHPSDYGTMTERACKKMKAILSVCKKSPNKDSGAIISVLLEKPRCLFFSSSVKPTLVLTKTDSGSRAEMLMIMLYCYVYSWKKMKICCSGLGTFLSWWRWYGLKIQLMISRVLVYI